MEKKSGQSWQKTKVILGGREVSKLVGHLERRVHSARELDPFRFCETPSKTVIRLLRLPALARPLIRPQAGVQTA